MAQIPCVKDAGEEGLKAIFTLSDLGPQIMRECIERIPGDLGKPAPADRYAAGAGKRLLYSRLFRLRCYAEPDHLQDPRRGILGGSDRYRPISSISHVTTPGKDNFRALLVSLGKTAHQLSGYRHGRR
jgi:hypothetical protein